MKTAFQIIEDILPEINGGHLGDANPIMDALFEAGYEITKGWQPIETAPKDGTMIDVLLNGKSRIPDVHWCLFDGYEEPQWLWLGWMDSPVEGGGCNNVNEITHWMPIPEAPTDHSAESNKVMGE